MIGHTYSKEDLRGFLTYLFVNNLKRAAEILNT